MQSEYERIRARTVEDPGTAGDEGEEAWASILRKWLPEGYQVRLKGRILSAEGTAGPQVDIVVKLYLAGGVAAAFECKNTLKSAHIDKAWETAAAIEELDGRDRDRSPFHALVPSICYGLLAHGYSWNKPGSDAFGMVTRKLRKLLESTNQICKAPSLICIANLASWDSLRISYDGPGVVPPELWEARKALLGRIDDRPTCAIQYSVAADGSNQPQPANPLGVLVANIVGRLAFEDATIRPLSQYFFASGMSGERGVPVAMKEFALESQFSAAMLSGFPNALTNGLNGSEWSLAFNF